jgi:hypothetical protein
MSRRMARCASTPSRSLPPLRSLRQQLCVLRALCAFASAALRPLLPLRSLRQQLCALCAFASVGHGGAVPLQPFVGARRGRVPTDGALCINTFAIFAAFAVFASAALRPSRLCVSGGTAGPCPDGWHAVHQHLRDLCRLCGLCVSSFASFASFAVFASAALRPLRLCVKIFSSLAFSAPLR